MSSPTYSGLLLIDKPEGKTSRQVDNAIQKIFKTRKVGHLGTLDPFATGLLVVAVNKGTKVLSFLKDEEKTYLASLRLGQGTSTGDKDGEYFEEQEIPHLSKERIEEVLASFLGKGEQIPPMTSAIKIDGTALYKLAHQGKEIERKPRPIEIYSIELVSFDGVNLVFKTKVSKGTYIRVLGEDIARALGSVGHLTSLRRLEIGDITLEHAVPLEEASAKDLQSSVPFLKHYPIHSCSEEEMGFVKNGRAFALEREEETILAVYGDDALAILTRGEDGKYHTFRGLF